MQKFLQKLAKAGQSIKSIPEVPCSLPCVYIKA